MVVFKIGIGIDVLSYWLNRDQRDVPSKSVAGFLACSLQITHMSKPVNNNSDGPGLGSFLSEIPLMSATLTLSFNLIFCN